MGDEPESEPEADSSKPDSAPLPAPPTPTTTTTEMAIVLPRDPEGNPNPSGPDPFPSWFTPKRLLVIFCIINMLNYVDRGAIASNGVNGSSRTCTDSGICTSGSGIQGDFNLNYFEDGVLSSAFMVGLLIASPIFASLAKRLIGVGLLVWTIATAGCGCSFDFWSIIICRMLVGVGEASFISLAAPFIDDNAPVAQTAVDKSILPMLATESLKALGGLGLLSLGGKYFLRRVFEVVAESRSSEAFVALCLLTVSGTSLLTQKLGFSDTLGAFLAGALLAETNFRTQVEADIRPFRGLLLGLFFVTTGTSIDMQLLFREWPNVLSLLAGLIVIKTLIITAIGPRVGLTLQESIRIGLLLSQGGEFAFVVFSLANRLGVLPLELNKLLIIVVVLSMALTPLLNEIGKKAAETIDVKFQVKEKAAEMVSFDATEPVVILGFGQMGQVLANFLSTPLASGLDRNNAGWPYVAFDLNPGVVKAARKSGFSILYGDGSRPAVLQSAGISSPKAVMIMYTEKERTIEAVQRIRLAFPAVPIYARARDLTHLLALKKAGATEAILENAETSLQLGSMLLKGLGVMSDDVTFLSRLVRDSMEIQAQEAVTRVEDQESNVMKPLQVRVTDLVQANERKSQMLPKDQSLSLKRPNIPIVGASGYIHSPVISGDDAEIGTDTPRTSESVEPDDGVKYCPLDVENELSSKNEDDEDQSLHCTSSTEGK